MLVVWLLLVIGCVLSIFLNLLIWYFWLDVLFWIIVEFCLFFRSFCVRYFLIGFNREILIVILLGMDWKEVFFFFFGCCMVNLLLFNFLFLMIWLDIGGFFLGVLLLFLRLVGVILNGLLLIFFFLNLFVMFMFVIFFWFLVVVVLFYFRIVCFVKLYKMKMVIFDRRFCL